jgi:hypothetical protein
MKKSFVALLAVIATLFISSVVAPTEAKAQRFYPATSVSKAAIVNTDTAIVLFDEVTSETRSFHLHALKDTGTISGKVVFYGYNNKVYKPLDSASFSAASLYAGNVLSYSFSARASNGDLLYSKYKIVITEAVMGRVKTITGEMLRRSN